MKKNNSWLFINVRKWAKFFIKEYVFMIIKCSYFFLIGGVIPQITNGIDNVSLGFEVASNLQFKITESTFYVALILLLIIDAVGEIKFKYRKDAVKAFSKHIEILLKIRLFVMGMNSTFFMFSKPEKESGLDLLGLYSKFGMIFIFLLPLVKIIWTLLFPLISSLKVDDNENQKDKEKNNSSKVYKNREGLKKKLRKCLFKKNSNSMVLLKGKWGIGKSYFLKEFLEELKKEGLYEVIEINAMTFDNKISLTKEIFSSIDKILKEYGIQTKASYEIIQYIDLIFGTIALPVFNMKKRGSNFQILKRELSDALNHLGEKKIILVIENLERTRESQKINDILAFLHEIEDMNNLNTIVVADEKRLLKELDKDYIQKFFMNQFSIEYEELEEILRHEEQLDEETKSSFINAYLRLEEKVWNEPGIEENESYRKFIKSFLIPRNVIRITNDYGDYENLTKVYNMDKEAIGGIIFLTLGLKESFSNETKELIQNINGLEPFLNTRPDNNGIFVDEHFIAKNLRDNLVSIYSNDEIVKRIMAVIMSIHSLNIDIKEKVEKKESYNINMIELSNIIEYYKYFGKENAQKKFKDFFDVALNFNKENIIKDFLTKDSLTYKLFYEKNDIKRLNIGLIKPTEKKKLLENLIIAFKDELEKAIEISEMNLGRIHDNKTTLLESNQSFITFLKSNIDSIELSKSIKNLELVKFFCNLDYHNETLNNDMALFHEFYKKIEKSQVADLFIKNQDFKTAIDDIEVSKESFEKKLIKLSILYSNSLENGLIEELREIKDKVKKVIATMPLVELVKNKNINVGFISLYEPSILSASKSLILGHKIADTGALGIKLDIIKRLPLEEKIYAFKRLFMCEKLIIEEAIGGGLDRGANEALNYLSTMTLDILEEEKLEDLLEFVIKENSQEKFYLGNIVVLTERAFKKKISLISKLEDYNEYRYLWEVLDNKKWNFLANKSSLVFDNFLLQSVNFIKNSIQERVSLLEVIVESLLKLKERARSFSIPHIGEVLVLIDEIKEVEIKRKILLQLIKVYNTIEVIQEILKLPEIDKNSFKQEIKTVIDLNPERFFQNLNEIIKGDSVNLSNVKLEVFLDEFLMWWATYPNKRPNHILYNFDSRLRSKLKVT